MNWPVTFYLPTGYLNGDNLPYQKIQFINEKLPEGNYTIPNNSKRFEKKTFNKKVRNKTDLRIAKKIIKDKDTINQTLKLANKYGEKAKNIMKDFESNPVRNALIDLVDFSLVRNY